MSKSLKISKSTVPSKRHPSISARAASRLRAVVADLRRHPERYDQSTFCRRIWTASGRLRPLCGSERCIAGHLVLRYRPSARVDGCGDLSVRGERVGWWSVASDVLGLSITKTLNLFESGDYWPAPFATSDPTVDQMAARVEHFIRTGE